MGKLGFYFGQVILPAVIPLGLTAYMWTLEPLKFTYVFGELFMAMMISSCVFCCWHKVQYFDMDEHHLHKAKKMAQSAGCCFFFMAAIAAGVGGYFFGSFLAIENKTFYPAKCTYEGSKQYVINERYKSWPYQVDYELLKFDVEYKGKSYTGFGCSTPYWRSSETIGAGNCRTVRSCSYSSKSHRTKCTDTYKCDRQYAEYEYMDTNSTGYLMPAWYCSDTRLGSELSTNKMNNMDCKIAIEGSLDSSKYDSFPPTDYPYNIEVVWNDDQPYTNPTGAWWAALAGVGLGFVFFYWSLQNMMALRYIKQAKYEARAYEHHMNQPLLN